MTAKNSFGRYLVRCDVCGIFEEDHHIPNGNGPDGKPQFTELRGHTFVPRREIQQFRPGSAVTPIAKRGVQYPAYRFRRREDDGAIETTMVKDKAADEAAKLEGWMEFRRDLPASPAAVARENGSLEEQIVQLRALEGILKGYSEPSETPYETLKRILDEHGVMTRQIVGMLRKDPEAVMNVNLETEHKRKPVRPPKVQPEGAV